MSEFPDPDGPLFEPPVPAASFATRLATLRRLTPSTVWNLVNRPLSRIRHDRLDGAVASRFTKPALESRPTRGAVCIIGAFNVRNGLSRAARYELERLHGQYPDAELVDVSKGSRGLVDYAAAHADSPPDVAIFLLQPNLVWKHLRGLPAGFLSRSYRISLAVWELPYFPPGWRFIDRFFHEYWTPTEFSAAALRLGTPLPVRVVPHPVTLPPGGRAASRPAGAAFGGLAIMDLSTCPDRKNPWAHIEAWQKAFGDREDAILTMKVRFSRRTGAIRRELLSMIGSAKNIRLLERELADDDVIALQNANDVCLSLHRAEGFGLTICEMLELGKPAIATDWSGNVEFMGHYANAHRVRYRLVPYRDYLRRYPGYTGDWAEADTDHAARLLRRVACRHEAMADAEPAARRA